MKLTREGDSEPVSIVVIDTQIPMEDEGSSSADAAINVNGLTRQGTGGSKTGSWVVGVKARSRTSATDAMTGKMMSWVKAVWVMIYYFFNQGFAEKHKERVYQREVRRKDRFLRPCLLRHHSSDRWFTRLHAPFSAIMARD